MEELPKTGLFVSSDIPTICFNRPVTEETLRFEFDSWGRRFGSVHRHHGVRLFTHSANVHRKILGHNIMKDLMATGLRGIVHEVSGFPIHFMFYRGNLDYFSNRVGSSALPSHPPTSPRVYNSYLAGVSIHCGIQCIWCV